MGQGTESCGGYEIHYDPIEAHLDEVRPDKMTIQHLKNKIRWAERQKKFVSCTHDEDQYDEMISMLQDEYYSRLTSNTGSKAESKPSKPKKPKKQARGEKQKMKCHCGNEYEARTADLKRGWGLSCSKRCSAIRRELGRPAATKINN